MRRQSRVWVHAVRTVARFQVVGIPTLHERRRRIARHDFAFRCDNGLGLPTQPDATRTQRRPAAGVEVLRNGGRATELTDSLGAAPPKRLRDAAAARLKAESGPACAANRLVTNRQSRPIAWRTLGSGGAHQVHRLFRAMHPFRLYPAVPPGKIDSAPHGGLVERRKGPINPNPSAYLALAVGLAIETGDGRARQDRLARRGLVGRAAL
jgi:hypothetical protein